MGYWPVGTREIVLAPDCAWVVEPTCVVPGRWASDWDVSAAAEAPDSGVLESLGDEIATLFAHVHAATYRLLVMIAEFDRMKGWVPSGQRSMAHWLHVRTGIDLGAARQKVRTARTLVHLPLTSAAMAEGRLSFSKVRALTRVATPETEADLLPLALGSTTAVLERTLREYRVGNREDEAERERRLFESRSFSVFPGENGLYVVRGELPPEVGALLMRAVDAASDALHEEERKALLPGVGPEPTERDTEREAARRRADAVGLLAERALAAGFSGPDAPISGTGPERYQVVVHVEAEAIADPRAAAPEVVPERRMRGRRSETPDGSAEPSRLEGAPVSGEPSVARDAHGSPEPSLPGPGPRCHLEDGTRLSAETARRVCCDAAVVRATHAPDGSVLDVGRRTRTISPGLRRALDMRDRGCRFPGCGSRFTDAHHVKHWADGGATCLANCVLLCRFHHRLVHEGGWTIEHWGRHRFAFFGPDGQGVFEGRWESPELPDTPVEMLVLENLARGAAPGAWEAAATWQRQRDVPDEVFFHGGAVARTKCSSGPRRRCSAGGGSQALPGRSVDPSPRGARRWPAVPRPRGSSGPLPGVRVHRTAQGRVRAPHFLRKPQALSHLLQDEPGDLDREGRHVERPGRVGATVSAPRLTSARSP